MYGTDGFKYYFAQSPDKFYMVMGADGLGALKSVIDRPVSNPASGDIKIAIDTLQGTGFNEFACSVNIIKLIKGVGQMMEAMPTQAPGMEMVFKEIISKLDFETQSTLVLGGQAADGQASMRLALPKQHLIEIVAMGVKIQQQMMASQQAMM